MSGRPDPAAYAIAGVAPRAVARPATPEAAAEALRAAARDRLAVVPWGGGTGLARAAAPARYDLALDLTALDGVVAHEPDDLTLTVGAGATLAALRAAVATHGQELPLEAAHLVHRLLAKDPLRRPQTPAELIAGLMPLEIAAFTAWMAD